VIWRRSLTALFASALLGACGSTTTPPHSVSGAHPSVARRRLDDRPPLVLVRRDGDPAPAVAFASAHDFGALASAAMAAAVKTRLAAQGLNVSSRPSALGFTVTLLAATPNEARRFVQALPGVLEQPFAANDPALVAVRAAVQALAAERLAGPSEETTAACTAELVAGETARVFDPASDKARDELGAWLKHSRAIKPSAFAAVGPETTLGAVEDALARGPDWPGGEPPSDAWPARDELGVDFATNTTHRLSFALRLANEDAAARAVEVLVAPRSTLARRLGALRPEWRIDRAAVVGRPRGACLRVDALPLAGEIGPAPADVAKAVTIVGEEAHAALAERARGGGLDDAILGATDPADAAAAAAWRALVGREKAGAERTFVAYAAGSAEKGRFDLLGALAALRAQSAEPLVELVRRGEPGQGRLWALLAPTCGTSPEASNDAGEAALVVSALARASTPGDVNIEPWIATDGVGLVAGTRRLAGDESSDAQAQRLGRALGELVATTRPSPTELVAARDDLALGVGGEQHRGLAVALDALTQGHPSWLEPRGTFAALASAPGGGFEAALGRWLSRPLRLAVLTNADPNQADVVRTELERWIRPVRGEVTRCPARSRAVSSGGVLTLSVAGDAPEGSYVLVPFPAYEHRLPNEARATLLLLNRSGGMLDQTLADLSASATALALGGPDEAALVVEVVAAEGQRAAAVDRLRQLFDYLAGGRLAPSDVEYARRELERQDAAEALDPRRRLVLTWRSPSRGAEPPLDATRLARWLASLRRSGTVVVNVTPRG
jgi:hypothetical protein